MAMDEAQRHLFVVWVNSPLEIDAYLAPFLDHQGYCLEYSTIQKNMKTFIVVGAIAALSVASPVSAQGRFSAAAGYDILSRICLLKRGYIESQDCLKKTLPALEILAFEANRQCVENGEGCSLLNTINRHLAVVNQMVNIDISPRR